MFERINITDIIREHLKTLRSLNQTSKGIYFPDLVLFFLLPIFISLWLTYKHIDLTEQISNIIAAIAILGGFLFNLLAIIYGAMDKLKVDATNNKIKKKFIKEIHSNISFCILLSIFSTVCLILYSYKLPDYCIYIFIKNGLLFINYFLLLLFLLTLLMVLNRVYVLLKKDANDL